MAIEINQVIRVVGNVDTGSLKLGMALPVGSDLQITGEQKTRKVTYVMGTKAEKVSLCFKGSGPLPLGDMEVTIISLG